MDVIPANSPQAKGWVERNHGLDQDLLAKELRIAGISTIEQANRLLRETYLPWMNEHFSRPAFDPADASDWKSAVPLENVDLTEILCFNYDWVITNDYVVRFER